MSCLPVSVAASSFNRVDIGARRGAIGGLFDESCADRQIDAYVAAGRDAFFEIVPPGGKMIDPAADRVMIRAEFFDREARSPAVVAERFQR